MKLIIIEDAVYKVTNREYKTLQSKISWLNSIQEDMKEYRRVELHILEYLDANIPNYASLGKVMLDWRL